MTAREVQTVLRALRKAESNGFWRTRPPRDLPRGPRTSLDAQASEVHVAGAPRRLQCSWNCSPAT